MIEEKRDEYFLSITEDKLPYNWAFGKIQDLISYDGIFSDGDWVETKDQDPSGDVRLIQLSDIGNGVFKNRSSRFLTYDKAIELNCKFLKINDVLIARLPEPLGRACLFPGDIKQCVTAVDVAIVRIGNYGVNYKWFLYFFNAPNVRSVIEILKSGTTRQRISRKNLSIILLPVPPLGEQHRIVQKIEELFTRLDAGVEALEKIKAQLKNYRQAVLKHAFEGELTKEWREANKDKLEPASELLERIKEERKKDNKGKYKELPPLDTSDLPELPEGWEWTRLGFLTNINPKLPNFDISNNIKVSFLPMKNIEELTGQYDLSLSKNIEEVRKGYTPFINGDVLFAKITPCMENGKIVVADNLINGIGFGSTEFHVIRPLPNTFESKILFFYMVQEGFRKNAQRNMTGSAGQLRVPVNYLREVSVPLPPLAEQQKIVEEIERRFSIANEIERVVNQSLKKSESLRQSILKRAFEGKLVSQDPNDEPADVLLERIKAEKQAQEKEKPKGKRRNKNG